MPTDRHVAQYAKKIVSIIQEYVFLNAVTMIKKEARDAITSGEADLPMDLEFNSIREEKEFISAVMAEVEIIFGYRIYGQRKEPSRYRG